MDSSKIMVAAVVVLAVGAGALLYWVAAGPATGANNAGNNAAEVINKPFEKDDFFPEFDLNHDKAITFAEFDSVYATWGQDKRFSRGPGQPGLDSKQAFAFFDQNSDGSIDIEDLRYAYDLAWQEFSRAAMAKGLTAKEWKGQKLALNQHQLDAYNKEKGALVVNELPFGGAFFDRKYLLTGRYGRVTKQDGASVEGFLSEREGRLWVVTTDARLLVFKPDSVTVAEDPNAPALEYINRVKDTPFDDVAANLKLALRCYELGLKTEAGAMFARVLIFDRENKQALDALRLKLDGDRYVPRGD